jgi:hypothetical protein
MAIKYAVIALTLIFGLSGCHGPSSDHVSASAASGPVETPVKITACQLMSDPAAYNHKLIEVSGRVSIGFEDFAIYADDCAAKDMVWLELGGSVDAGTIYCCGDHRRNVPVMVEDVVTPLVKDERTDRFVKVAQSGKPAGGPTTLIGRYFSGRKLVQPWGTFWEGYGHMGCCSLLVIQQVLD